MILDDYDGQMIFGEAFDICLTGEEKLRKNLIQETCPDRGSNPGPLRDTLACCRLLHCGEYREGYNISEKIQNTYTAVEVDVMKHGKKIL